ncbi:MAG: hypothetical protein ACQES4_11635, partial [Bacillota bacterium]
TKQQCCFDLGLRQAVSFVSEEKPAPFMAGLSERSWKMRRFWTMPYAARRLRLVLFEWIEEKVYIIDETE